jgi:predicted secreted protein
MSVTGAIVLFVVLWFMMMFIILPIRARSQADAGEVVPGTPEGAPANFRLGRTALIVTLWALLVWAISVGIILSGWISVEDLDWMNVLDERVPN